MNEEGVGKVHREINMVYYMENTALIMSVSPKSNDNNIDHEH